MNNECKADLLNLSQAWVHCVLYSANVYPKQSFQTRTMYGIEMPVSKSKAVKEYLTRIFEKVRGCIQQINFIEIEVATKNNDQNMNRVMRNKSKSQEQNLSEKPKITGNGTHYRFYFNIFPEQEQTQENRIQK